MTGNGMHSKSTVPIPFRFYDAVQCCCACAHSKEVTGRAEVVDPREADPLEVPEPLYEHPEEAVDPFEAPNTPVLDPREVAQTKFNAVVHGLVFDEGTPHLTAEGRYTAELAAHILNDYEGYGVTVCAYLGSQTPGEKESLEACRILAEQRSAAIRDLMGNTCGVGRVAARAEVHDGVDSRCELVCCSLQNLLEMAVEQEEQAIAAQAHEDVELRQSEANDVSAPPEEPVPEPGVTCDFITDMQNTKQSITFTRKPLGMLYRKRQPIRVTGFKKQSHARDLGVGKGWIMVAVSGREIFRMRYSEAAQLLDEQIGALRDME